MLKTHIIKLQYINLYKIIWNYIIIISYYIILYVFPKGSPFFPRLATAQAAADGMMDPLVGRDEEIDRAIQILARRSKMPGSEGPAIKTRGFSMGFSANSGDNIHQIVGFNGI